jgi:hypothetical protein
VNSRLLVVFPMLLLAATATLAAGCSKSGNSGGGAGAQVAPLSPEEQAAFDKTANNVSESTQWDSNSPATPAAAALSTTSTPSGKAQLNKLVAANCKIDFASPENPPQGPTMSMDMKFSVDGDNCPISMGWRMKTDISQTSMTMDFGIFYQPKTSDATAAIDVQSYKLDIKMTGAADNNGTSSMNISGGGEIVSQSQGDVKIAISGTATGQGENGTMTQVTRFSYPTGMAVELKQIDTMVSGQKPATVYFINGKSVSEKQYKSYLTKFGLDHAAAGAGSQSPNQPTQPNQPAQPGGPMPPNMPGNPPDMPEMPNGN